ncbi:MAG: Na+/H+ antiporter NhaA [Actinomycetia bacterium]|nr:Na+/H+ antiporter NhaA [Actinomycetes bacterium]
MASAPHSDLTWLSSDSALARNIGRPLNRFLHVEAAGGLVLLAATAAALIWANSPWSDTYFDFWHTEIELQVGAVDVFSKAGHAHFTMEELVNDGLMAVFFFVIGLEIKRELVVGMLRNRRDAALPLFAAIGGIVVPALIYAAFNAGGAGADGWGIPMATDIAFAVGVVSLLGDKIPRALRVFLLSLAIVDDIAAILVIAVFYTEQVSIEWLVVAALLGVVVYGMRRAHVWYYPVYIAVGVLMWWAGFKSGVHATIAGVALGLITPARPLLSEDDALEIAGSLSERPDVSPSDVQLASFHLRESVSVAERLETAIHPISSFLIIPVFALANAGVELSASGISDAARSSVTLGVVVGLVVGKTVGITLFSMVATKLGLAQYPTGMGTRQLLGLSMLAGIGFTVSLFITGLAGFDDPSLVDQAKIGILAASALAATGGLLILSRAAASPGEAGHDPPSSPRGQGSKGITDSAR